MTYILQNVDDLMMQVNKLMDMTSAPYSSQKSITDVIEKIKLGEDKALKKLGAIHYIMTIAGNEVATPININSPDMMVWQVSDLL
jgi:hypothetical protein